MNSNKKYKDSLFTKLFSNKIELINLYNAIKDTNYSIDNNVEIITLENILFMDKYNDLCFTINNKNIYRSDLIKIPTPEFIVLYNRSL